MVGMVMDMVTVTTLLRMVIVPTPAGTAISTAEDLIAGEEERSNLRQRI
jgi:hypothetical protein